MEYASLVRASDEDLLNIFEAKTPDEAWEQISSYTDVLVYTANAGGVYLRSSLLSFHMEVELIEPVSTIGAGDTFNAGLLYGLWKKGIGKEQIKTLDRATWEGLIATAIQFSREVCLSYDNYLPMGYALYLKEKR